MLDCLHPQTPIHAYGLGLSDFYLGPGSMRLVGGLVQRKSALLNLTAYRIDPTGWIDPTTMGHSTGDGRIE